MRGQRRDRSARGRARYAAGATLTYGLRPHKLPAQPDTRTRVLPQPRYHRRTYPRHGPARRGLGARPKARPARLPDAVPRPVLGDMFYELSASTWGPEEIEAVRRSIERGRFTMSEEVACFEREFAAYFGMKYGVMVNSGSSANLIAVAALFYKKDRPLQRGD